MAKQFALHVKWNGGASDNLITNPSFETNTTGWSTFGTWATHARNTSFYHFGAASLKLVNSSGSDALTWHVFTATATVHTVSIWIYREAGAGTLTLILQEDFGGFAVKGTTTANATTGLWQRVEVTASGLTIGADYRLRVTLADGITAYIDGAQAEASSAATPYYDGSIGDESDALMDLSLDRGRKALIRSGGNGFAPQDVGECVLTLRNTTGRYDPLNASSPLYPDVAPGKEVTIRLTDGSIHKLFTGHIYDLKPVGNAQSRKVQIIVRDGWQWLKDRKITSAPQSGIGTHTAITTVLTAAAYPFATSIATGEDTIPYWWADNKDATGEIQSVADSEFGILYAAVDGTLTFKARTAQWLTASSVTFASTDLNELNFAQPWEVLRNVVQVKVYPTDILTNQVLWVNTKTFKLRPSKSLTLNVKYTYEGNPTSAQNIATPVAGTDYRAFENANGSGANLTANIGVVVTAKGEEASIALTNNSATRLAYITLLQLRGDVINRGDAVTVEKDTSGGSNRRTFLLDVPWQQDVELAQEYANYLAGLLDAARGNPTLRTNRDTAKQCLELGTVFTLSIASLGLSNAYRVEGIHHDWSAQSPNVLNTRIFGGNKDEASYFTLDVSELDGADVLAY